MTICFKNSSDYTMQLVKDFKNLVALSIEKSIRIFGGLFVSGLIAKKIGVTEFGVLQFSLIILSTFGSFIHNPMIKNIFINRYKQGNYRNFLAGVLIINLISFLLSLVFTFFSSKNEIELKIGFIASLFILSFPLQYGKYLMELKEDFIRIGQFESITIISLIIARLIGLYLDLSLMFFVLTYLLEPIVLSFLFFNRKLFKSLKQISLREIFADLNRNLSFFLIPFISVLYVKIDQVLIKSVLPIYDLSIYSTAVRINDLVYLLPIMLQSIFYPKLVLAERTKERDWIMSIFVLLMILCSVLFITSIFLFGENVVTLLYGSEFIYSSEILKILSLSSLPTLLGYSWTMWNSLNEKGVEMLKAYLIGIVFNLAILSLILIIDGDLSKIALVTVLGFYFSSFYGIIKFNRKDYNRFIYEMYSRLSR